MIIHLLSPPPPRALNLSALRMCLDSGLPGEAGKNPAPSRVGETDVAKKPPQINHLGGLGIARDKAQQGFKCSFLSECLTAGRTNCVIHLSVCSACPLSPLPSPAPLRPPCPKCKHFPSKSFSHKNIMRSLLSPPV